MIDVLQIHKVITPDDDSLERKRRRLAEREAALAGRQTNVRVVPQVEIETDQVLLIQHAREWLRTHPDEAMKWYNRAKYSIAQNQGGSHDMLYHREEVLAVWEYLERTVDMQVIARVFDFKRGGETPA